MRAMRMQFHCHLRVFEELVDLHNAKVILTTIICITDFDKVSQTKFHDLHHADHLLGMCVSFSGLQTVHAASAVIPICASM